MLLPEGLLQHGFCLRLQWTELLQHGMIHLGIAEDMIFFEPLQLYFSGRCHPLTDFRRRFRPLG